MKKLREHISLPSRVTLGRAALLQLAVVLSAQGTPAHLTTTERAAEAIESGWVAFGGNVPVTVGETLSAIWYSPEAGGVRWIQSPAPPGGEPPHHALMGVRYDPAGADTLRFEDHERGVLAVIGRSER